MRSYNLSTEKAKAATQGGFIEAAGLYPGKIVHAKAITSQKGTEGIEFAFVADTGERADRLPLWTYSATGEELRALNIVNAMMTIAQVRKMEPASGKIEEYDYDAGARVVKEAMVFPEFAGKRMGLLIQIEEYQTSKGELRTKPVIWGCYDPQTMRTAAEIIAKATEAKEVHQAARRLEANPVKRLRGSASPTTAASAPADPFGSMSDDIPF